MEDKITTPIPGAVIDQAIQKINELKALLAPYTHTLTAAERQSILKMSNKSYTFVGKVVDYCFKNPEFKPGYLDEAALKMDFDTADGLRPVLEQCNQLAVNIDDTVMLAGNEAFTNALVYYSAVRTAAKNGETHAKVVFEDLSERFPGRRTKPADNTTK
ncbi:hypothetical protein [Taibaiella soli]|uniref:Uncharacterized protein n=1 Tax=Taibaiella soli TaxID=1649169 RepID=A0A2W2AR93_9BACT|nr:hypothetical protein [Taibaiella soli]PZF74980.1 hypothetical protein DN068_00045 [Taibaiella soli]